MLNYAVVQLGYCVFGAGESAEEAYEEAARWMDTDVHIDEETGEEIESKMTPARVRQICGHGRRNRVDGAIVLMDCDHPEFDSYLANQGGFVKTQSGWQVA